MRQVKGNFQQRTQLKDMPRIWRKGAKALKMQGSAWKPQCPLQKREPAGQGRQWTEPGGKGCHHLLVTASVAEWPPQPSTPSRISQRYSPPSADLSELACLPHRVANRHIKVAASHFQEALKPISEMAMPMEIKSLPTEESEGLKHQKRVGGLTNTGE